MDIRFLDRVRSPLNYSDVAILLHLLGLALESLEEIVDVLSPVHLQRLSLLAIRSEATGPRGGVVGCRGFGSGRPIEVVGVMTLGL